MKRKEKPVYSGFRMKPLDFVVIAISAGLIVFIAGMSFSENTSYSHIIIRGPDKTWDYPIESDLELRVSGPLGETVVRIANGRAAITSSPCSGQTCVAAGELHRNGQWAACLPNRVVVLMEGRGGKDAIDAASW